MDVRTGGDAYLYMRCMWLAYWGLAIKENIPLLHERRRWKYLLLSAKET